LLIVKREMWDKVNKALGTSVTWTAITGFL